MKVRLEYSKDELMEKLKELIPPTFNINSDSIEIVVKDFSENNFVTISFETITAKPETIPVPLSPPERSESFEDDIPF